METGDFRESIHLGDWARGTSNKIHLPAVLLDEVLVRGAVVIGLDLVAVIVGCAETEAVRQTDRRRGRQLGKPVSGTSRRPGGVLRDRKVLRF